jgi:hypothetical protein
MKKLGTIVNNNIWVAFKKYYPLVSLKSSDEAKLAISFDLILDINLSSLYLTETKKRYIIVNNKIELKYSS